MKRRLFCQAIGCSSLGAWINLARAAPSQASPIDWDYSGGTSPEHWGELSGDYQTCQLGQQQSPIDLQLVDTPDPSEIQLSYQTSEIELIHTKHTVQANCRSANFLQIGDRVYTLQQFHFHLPSEHQINSQAYDLELHFVHRHADRDLAVVAIFLQIGEPNLSLDRIAKSAPRQLDQAAKTISAIDLRQLLPRLRQAYHYQGSLTTPPCTEAIDWVVMQQPISLSAAQFDRFKSLITPNARPLQPLNQRSIWRL